MLNVSAIIFRIVGNILGHITNVFTDIVVQQKTILIRKNWAHFTDIKNPSQEPFPLASIYEVYTFIFIVFFFLIQ
jgi:hypothetical protein